MLRQSTLKKEYAMSEMARELTRLAQITNLKDLEAAVKDAYKTVVMGEQHAHKKPPKANILLLASPEAKRSNNNNSGNSTSSASPMKGTQKTAPNAASNHKQGYRATTAPSPVKVGASQSRSGSISTADAQAQNVSSTASDEALGYDCKQAVDESAKQMEYMSRTIQTLRNALENTKLKADRVRRDAVAEGSVLIDECNKLRKENKLLVMKMRGLEHAISSHHGSSAPMLHATKDSLHGSSSYPELIPSLQISSPENDVTQETSSPTRSKLLHPLSTVKQQQRQHTPSLLVSSPFSRHSGGSTTANNNNSSNPLPFARLERERAKARSMSSSNDNSALATLVERQKHEIQRLQRQVQLLLADKDELSGA
ncbi:hypothetical protein FI667_g5434, partial [Globisporangium splendens]